MAVAKKSARSAKTKTRSRKVTAKKASVPPKPTLATAKPPSADVRKKATELLLKKGRDQGFVTQEEILEIFPDAENRIEELDDLYDRLLKLGIDVFESVTEEEMREDEAAST